MFNRRRIDRNTNIRIESGGFIFNPVKCVRKGDTLTCSISYVNKRDDEVRVAIRSRQSFPHQGNYSASYLTDNYGNQYPVDVQIGNKVSGKYQSDGFVEEIFLSQTPVNVNFISTDVKQDGVVKFLVEIFCGPLMHPFSNVPMPLSA